MHKGVCGSSDSLRCTRVLYKDRVIPFSPLFPFKRGTLHRDGAVLMNFNFPLVLIQLR